MSEHCPICQTFLNISNAKNNSHITCPSCKANLVNNSCNNATGDEQSETVGWRTELDLPKKDEHTGLRSLINNSSKIKKNNTTVNTIEIPGYKLISCIGSGAMGQVFYGQHIQSGREVAIKILASHLSNRADLVARFQREAAALGSFRHNNIVAIIDSGQTGNIHYLCMEYIKGATLRKILQKKPLPLLLSIECAMQIASGLQAAHKRGVIHRDLKPENILLEVKNNESNIYNYSRLVIADFGLANIKQFANNPHPNLTHTKLTMGTINYMAPEQHTDAKRVDDKVDIYACGVIFYECLVGDLPLGRFLLPTEKGLKAPAIIDKIVSQMLARLPDKRYQNTELLLQDLLEAKKQAKSYLDELNQISIKNDKKNNLNKPAKNLLPIKINKYLSSLFKTPKPILTWSVISFILGFMALFFFDFSRKKEVIILDNKIFSINNKSFFTAPQNIFTKDKMNLSASWNSDSSGWQYQNNKINYLAKEGKSYRMRKDLSLALSSLKITNNTFQTNLILKPVLNKKNINIKTLASNHLKQPLPSAAGGVFLIDSSQKNAIGILLQDNNNCSIVSLQKNNNSYSSSLLKKITCPKNKFNKAHIKIKCDPKNKLCSSTINKKIITSFKVDNLHSNKWTLALGCRNMDCIFF